MIFSTPLAAFGLLTAAALAAIYCFRRKSPPRRVGSLLLWPRPAPSAASARRRDRLLLPPLFWLELFALLALVAAALSPLVWRRSSGTLHVILDVSASMEANPAESAGRKAADFLDGERRRGRKDVVRVRTAGDDLALARELAAAKAVRAPGDEILVLTDKPPAEPPKEPGVRWRAFGTSAANRAITAFRRRRISAAEDSLFVEVRSFGAPDAALTVEGVGTKPLAFDDEGRARLVTTVPSSLGELVVSLPADRLAADDRVVIPPPEVPALTASVSVTDPALERRVRRALDATGYVKGYVGVDRADFIVTDQPAEEPVPPTQYEVRFLESKGGGRLEPVWADPGEPLLAGIELAGDPYRLADGPLPGTAVAFLGTRPLVSVASNACYLAFDDPDLAFFRSPAFPALMQNAMSAAFERLPKPPPAKAAAAFTNLLDAAESDLRPLATVSLGSHAEAPEDAVRTSSVAYVPALLALCALALHFLFVRRRATLAVIALVLLALARPVFPRADRHGAVIALADRSRSMTDAALREQERLLSELSAARPAGASLGVIAFGERPVVEQRPAPTGFAGFAGEVRRDGSDVAAALVQADSLRDPSAPARLLVLSDGLFTAPPGVARSPTDTLLQTRAFAHDLCVSRVDAPASVAPRAVIPVTAWVRAAETTTNAFTLLRGTNVIARGARVFREGLTPLVFRDFATRPGLRRYTLAVEPSSDDPCVGNNRAEFLVETTGKRPLLLLRDGSGSAAAEVIRRAGVDVDIREAATFDASLAALADYGGVILENVPAKRFSTDALRNLAAYATDFGGGLALTGGENSFGPGGWYGTPVEDVLPVSLELRQDHRKYAVALAIVMDRSGSMAMNADNGRTKMEMANLGAAGAIEMLTDLDEVAVIAVDSAPHVVLPLVSGGAAHDQLRRVRSIESMGGGIFVEQGLLAGFRELEKAAAPIKHVILFADASDSEEPGAYEKYLSEAAKAGVTVSVIALGKSTDCDAGLLRDIARLGGGECWFESNANEIPRLFLQDTYLAAKTAMCTNRTPLAASAPLRQLSDLLPARLDDAGGYNLTYIREGAETAIATADEEHAPFLAFRRVGLGRTLAFAGELSGRHAAPLMTSPSGAELTAAIARWTLGDEGTSVGGFHFERRLVPGGVLVTAVADEENPATAVPNSGLPLVILRDRSGGAEKSVGALTWSGADELSAFVPLAGDETAFPIVLLPGGERCRLPPVCLPHPSEFVRPADPKAGKRALERLAATSGGRTLTNVSGVWETLPVVRRALQLAPAVYLLAAVLFLYLVFVRRLGVGLKWNLALPKLPRPKGSVPAKPRGPVGAAPERPVPAKPAAAAPERTNSTAAALALAKRRSGQGR